MVLPITRKIPTQPSENAVRKVQFLTSQKRSNLQFLVNMRAATYIEYFSIWSEIDPIQLLENSRRNYWRYWKGGDVHWKTLIRYHLTSKMNGNITEYWRVLDHVTKDSAKDSELAKCRTSHSLENKWKDVNLAHFVSLYQF